MSELPITPATPDDWPGVASLLATVFHSTQGNQPTENEVFEPDRSLLVKDDGAVVAHAGVFTRELAVPGATVPAAHVTMVGVVPTHRRRRLLTRMMHRQLQEVPEPVAVLWASEGQIYGRFGYGMASHRVSLRIENREVRLPEPGEPGRFRALPADAALPVLRPLYDQVWPDHPGWSSRNDRWWQRRLSDPPERREGAGERRITSYERTPGQPVGYALWRTRGDWGATGPDGEVRVEEVVAADPEAHLALWRFLLEVDLTRSVSMWLGGMDDPLLYTVNEPRRLGTTLGDGLFVRITDLPAALTARRYAAPMDLVWEVTDPLLERNSGRWRLTTDGDKTRCVRTDDAPDLVCGIEALGSAYLGGIPVGALGNAGQVRALRPEALVRASAGFGWHRAPMGNEIF